MYLCICKAISVAEAVEQAKRSGASPEALVENLGLDDGDACGRCLRNIGQVCALVQLNLETAPAQAPAPAPSRRRPAAVAAAV